LTSAKKKNNYDSFSKGTHNFLKQSCSITSIYMVLAFFACSCKLLKTHMYLQLKNLPSFCLEYCLHMNLGFMAAKIYPFFILPADN